MRLAILLVSFLSSGGIGTASESDERIHFKIHVPEIVEHQMHTKTIFIHVHQPKPKLKSPKRKSAPRHRQEDKHLEWSTWSSHDHQEAHEDERRAEQEQSSTGSQTENRKDKSRAATNQPGQRQNQQQGQEHGQQQDQRQGQQHGQQEGQQQVQHKKPGQSGLYTRYRSYDRQRYQYPASIHSVVSNQNDHDPRHDDDSRDSYLPRPETDDYLMTGKGQDGLVGYSYPPQYAQNTPDDRGSNEIDEIDDYGYQDGRSTGGVTESKRLYAGETNRFEESEHREEDYSSDEGQDAVKGRTLAGRYFLDELENGERRKRHRKYRRTR